MQGGALVRAEGEEDVLQAEQGDEDQRSPHCLTVGGECIMYGCMV